MDALKEKSESQLNELFANSLALEILGEKKMLLILIKGGKMTEDRARQLMRVYKKFLLDYKQKLEGKF